MEVQIIECLDNIELLHFFKGNLGACANDDVQRQIDVVYKALKTYLEYSEDSWEEATQQLQKNHSNGKSLKRWITVAESLLCVKIIMCTSLDKPYLTDAAARKLINFIKTTGATSQIKARALYNVALCMELENPKLCYDSSMQAFNLEPRLASLLYERNYVYDRKRINDSYFRSCPICGSSKASPVYCVQQLLAIEGGSTLSPAKLWMKCDSCDNLYAYNFPVSKMAVMNGHYTGDSPQLTIRPRFSLGQICSDMFNKIKSYTSGEHYLEVGVGNGEMLACALEMGYDVDAVEICREDCEKISAVLGLDIQCCDFVEFNTDRRYDVIVMGDVLEHVSKPMKVLEKAYEYLNAGGILWLSTPNYNSAFSRLMKLKDPMWNQVNHFTYFSYESLLPILEGLGFQMKCYEISKRYNGSMELYLQK